MAEEVSPESKLYVKEEIERSRKEFKEDLKYAQSRATRTFATIAMIVGLLGSLGIYGFVKSALSDTAIANVEKDAKEKHDNVLVYEADANTYAKQAEEHLKEILNLKRIVNLPIGTIVPSMLAPDEFAATVGDPNVFDANESGWVLADGQKDITTSRYGQLSDKSKTPDLRGMFLRGMNVNGGQDPEKDRIAGHYQPDALQRHKHATKPPVWELTGWQEGASTDIGYTRHEAGRNAPKVKISDVTEANADVETRPKNVAVYFYIKIN